MEIRNKIRNVEHSVDIAKITLVGVPDRTGIAALIFESLARAGINVDTIVQNTSIDGVTNLTFMLARADLGKAMKVVVPIAKSIGARACDSDATIGKVSIVGTGLQNAPGYAATMFRVLGEHGINIQLINASQVRLTCIIEESRVAEAVKALHRAFRLDVEIT